MMFSVKYPQSFMLSAGRYACYALQIINIARRSGAEVNDYDGLVKGIQHGCIAFNAADYNDGENFYVKDPAGLLSLLTGDSWSVRREGNTYRAKNGEYVVNFYAKNKANADNGVGHFDAECYHTLQDSVTVRVGKVYSTRVFKRV